MPARIGGARRRKKADLTEAQYWELVLGPRAGSAFEDDTERGAAWRYHRDVILADWPGRINPLFGERMYDRSES